MVQVAVEEVDRGLADVVLGVLQAQDQVVELAVEEGAVPQLAVGGGEAGREVAHGGDAAVEDPLLQREPDALALAHEQDGAGEHVDGGGREGGSAQAQVGVLGVEPVVGQGLPEPLAPELVAECGVRGQGGDVPGVLGQAVLAAVAPVGPGGGGPELVELVHVADDQVGSAVGGALHEVGQGVPGEGVGALQEEQVGAAGRLGPACARGRPVGGGLASQEDGGDAGRRGRGERGGRGEPVLTGGLDGFVSLFAVLGRDIGVWVLRGVLVTVAVRVRVGGGGSGVGGAGAVAVRGADRDEDDLDVRVRLGGRGPFPVAAVLAAQGVEAVL